MICFGCAREFHSECRSPGPNGCCCESATQGPTEGLQEAFVSTPQRGPGRPEKDNEEISVSAGRKRAAVEHQVHEHLYCEWHGLANCGGGRVPISGCYDGLQKHRHHGPVKTTYENDRTNIHLICPSCHNRWHAKNDPVYDTDEYAEMPHEPRPMTIEEYILVASRSNNEDSTSST